MIEATIRARLAADATLNTLTGGRYFPSQPTVNTDLPFIVFTVNGAETNNYTSGPSSLTRYTFTIDSWAIDADALWPILDRVKAVLHGWRDTPTVQHCFLTSSVTDQQEENKYHGQQQYTLWHRSV